MANPKLPFAYIEIVCYQKEKKKKTHIDNDSVCEINEQLSEYFAPKSEAAFFA